MTLPVFSAEQIEEATVLPAQVRLLLREGRLPAGVAVALVADFGAPALMDACENQFLDDEQWTALYAAAPAVGRAALVTGRVLSTRQRSFVVVEQRETNATVLELIVDQLDRIELDVLSAQHPTQAAADLIGATQQDRRAGTQPIRSVDGRGLVIPPEEVGDLPWAQEAVVPVDFADLPAAAQAPSVHGRAFEQKWAEGALSVLRPVLGEDVNAWLAMAHLLGEFTGTWQELAWTAAALTAPPVHE